LDLLSNNTHLCSTSSFLRFFVILLFTVLHSVTSFSQKIVLDNEPEELYEEVKGPGGKNYIHPYVALGVIPDYDELAGAKINGFLSNEYVFGVRYKRKIFSFYQAGVDISGRFLQYRIEDEEGVPDPLNPLSEHWNRGKQILRTNSMGLELYNRLRAGKGNNLGYYIDIGIRGDWNYINKQVIRSSYDIDENPYGKVKTVNRKLAFMKKTALYVTGRAGIKKVILYGSYRFTDIFNDKYPIPELPPMVFGVQWVI